MNHLQIKSNHLVYHIEGKLSYPLEKPSLHNNCGVSNRGVSECETCGHQNWSHTLGEQLSKPETKMSQLYDVICMVWNHHVINFQKSQNDICHCHMTWYHITWDEVIYEVISWHDIKDLAWPHYSIISHPKTKPDQGMKSFQGMISFWSKAWHQRHGMTSFYLASVMQK